MLIGSKKAEDFLLNLSTGGQTPSFTQEIEVVILGSCSSGHGNFYDPEVGLSTVDGGAKMNLKFWCHHLNGIKGNVLILTECCGQYTESQLRELRDEFPEICFIAPRIRDYYDRIQFEEIREDLVKAGVIKVS
jgi:hypothetical protein